MGKRFEFCLCFPLSLIIEKLLAIIRNDTQAKEEILEFKDLSKFDDLTVHLLAYLVIET